MRDRERDELIAEWDRAAEAVDGEVSVALRTLDGPVAGLRADVPHYAASTVKLAVAAASLAALDHDSDARRRIVVRSTFPSKAGGTFTMLQRDDQDDPTWALLGRTLPVSTLLERMLADSSNIATNLLAEDTGLDGVRAIIDSAGATGMRVHRLIGDQPAEESGLTNVVTAQALSQLMGAVAAGRLLPSEETDALLRLSSRQTYRRLVPAGLPDGTWSAGKAGWNDAVRHDVALIRPQHAPQYVLAVCTTTGLGEPAERLVARLSAITWEHWARWHSS